MFRAAIFVLAAFLVPVHAHAQNVNCASGDAQIYFESINDFMKSQGRDAFAWNEALANAAEKNAQQNSAQGKLETENSLSEDDYDLSRVVILPSTGGGTDFKKMLQRPDFTRPLLSHYFKDVGTACADGRNGKGPYRTLILGVQKTDIPENERKHCGPGYARAVLTYTNDYRKLMHLPALTWSDQLAGAAETQANYMASIDNAQHEGPKGNHAPERVEEQGYDYHWVLENVASGQGTPLNVMMDWRRSPGHDKNLRNPDVKEMGAACADAAHTKHQIFWAQVFGERR